MSCTDSGQSRVIVEISEDKNIINVSEVKPIVEIEEKVSVIEISSVGVAGRSGTSGTSGTSGVSGTLLISGSTPNGIITLSELGAPFANVSDNLIFDDNTLILVGTHDIRSYIGGDGIIIEGGSSGSSGYSVSIKPDELTNNRNLILADGDTILVAGKMVSDDRTIEISGTTNQINVFPSSSVNLSNDISFSLSLPQDINVNSSPTFGGLILNGELVADDISVFNSTIQFTNDNNIVGIVTASAEGILINGTLFGDTFVSGNFTGLGDNLFFNRVGTKENGDSTMVIGNYYSDMNTDEYEFKQTTIFKNGNIIISGSVEIADNGYLILNPLNTPPLTSGDNGGLYYSTDGYYYLYSTI